MDKPKVFVIMPFLDDFFELYRKIEVHFKDDFEFSHAGSSNNQQNIMFDIIPPIVDADIILADLTGINPNVMYELGIAHCFHKKTIIITQDELSKLPFDLKQYRAKVYSMNFSKIDELLEYLYKVINGAINNSIEFSDPIADFLNKKKSFTQNLLEKINVRVDTIHSEGDFYTFVNSFRGLLLKIIMDIDKVLSEKNRVDEYIAVFLDDIERISNDDERENSLVIAAKRTFKFFEIFSTWLIEQRDMSAIRLFQVERSMIKLYDYKFVSLDPKEDFGEILNHLYIIRMRFARTKQVDMAWRIDAWRHLIPDEINKIIDDAWGEYLNWAIQAIDSLDMIIEKLKCFVGEFDFSSEK